MMMTLGAVGNPHTAPVKSRWHKRVSLVTHTDEKHWSSSLSTLTLLDRCRSEAHAKSILRSALRSLCNVASILWPQVLRSEAIQGGILASA